MTTTEQKIKVMQAHIDGKIIQVRDLFDYESSWVDYGVIDIPSWNWADYEYRIKPGEEYRPYKNTDEMIEDYCSRANVCCNKMTLPQIWIKRKKYSTSFLILEYGGNIVQWNDRDNYSLGTLFKDFEYLDGSPIGKKVE